MPGAHACRPDLGEVWQNRAIIGMLAKRQLRGRYQQTVIGVFWTLIQPVSYMIVLNLFFSLTGRIHGGSMPYPLFLLSGLLFYQFFVKCLNDGTASLSNNEALLSRVFLPRLVFRS